jgi:hypothetical protein
MTQHTTTPVEPVIKYSKNSTDVRICYKSGRAVSTIQKMEDGKYRVVKLYEEEVTDCGTYNIAREVAKSAAMTQAPRTKKDAA